VKSVLVVEMNVGQMVEDVQLGIGRQVPVHFYGRTGGSVPLPDEILDHILTLDGHPRVSLDSGKGFLGELLWAVDTRTVKNGERGHQWKSNG
jgi:hypothetical protein